MVAGGISDISFSDSPSIETPYCNSIKVEVGSRFNLRSYNMVKDYSLETERSTRITGYHLRGCMEARFWTITISGETVEKVPKQILG